MDVHTQGHTRTHTRALSHGTEHQQSNQAVPGGPWVPCRPLDRPLGQASQSVGFRTVPPASLGTDLVRRANGRRHPAAVGPTVSLLSLSTFPHRSSCWSLWRSKAEQVCRTPDVASSDHGHTSVPGKRRNCAKWHISGLLISVTWPSASSSGRCHLFCQGTNQLLVS